MSSDGETDTLELASTSRWLASRAVLAVASIAIAVGPIVLLLESGLPPWSWYLVGYTACLAVEWLTDLVGSSIP